MFVEMRRVAATLMLGVIATLSTALALLLLTPIPSTTGLDADLLEIRNQINRAAAESDKYGAGAIKALIELRRQTLENTEAMLLQKRASFLRRIDLTYTIDGHPTRIASETELQTLGKDISQAEKKLHLSKEKASEYTGGLVQTLSLVSVATDELTVSQLQLKFYAIKYGLPIFGLAKEQTNTQPPGQVVRDRDAL
jgi:hypothetical protein